MKRNIFELAKKNVPNIQKQYNQKINLHKKLKDIRKKINEEAYISTNMKPASLISFLKSNEYSTFFQRAKKDNKKLWSLYKSDWEHCKISSRKLRKYFDGRLAFTQSFKNSKSFKYASLNLGRQTNSRFGACCVIFGRNTFNNLVFVKEDSLNYFDGTQFLRSEFLNDIATPSHAPDLAILKHHDKLIKIIGNKGLDKIICSEKNYIEAITCDVININKISLIKLTKKMADDIENISVLSRLKIRISLPERKLYATYIHICKLMKKNNVNWG